MMADPRRGDKASQWAKRQPRELHLRQIGGYSTIVFMVTENGVAGMRIDNAGPFSKREALKLKRWIEEYFDG